jgi:hypothetical protein
MGNYVPNVCFYLAGLNLKVFEYGNPHLDERRKVSFRFAGNLPRVPKVLVTPCGDLVRSPAGSEREA